MEWISIKDNLPKSDEDLLLYSCPKKFAPTYIPGWFLRESADNVIGGSYIEEVCAFMDADGENEVFDVTHWMILEPPKE